MKRNIRVLLCKIGQDSHDQEIKVVASALRDAGMEVIYTGLWQSTEAVTNMAIQEDVDIIGVSCLNYEHLLLPKLMREVGDKIPDEIPIVAGGIIPPNEAEALKVEGIKEIFPSGSNTIEMAKQIRSIVERVQSV